MKPKLVISDLDGVIVNSEAEHFLSFQKMLRLDYGIDYTHEDDKEFLGTTDDHVFQMLKQRHPQILAPLEALIARRTRLFVEGFKTRVRPLPCVVSLFEYLTAQQIPLALGTSAAKDIADFVVTTLDLRRFFKTIVSADDVQQGKPAPDIPLEIARRMNVEPKNCLVLEDSRYGVQAAKTAGMRVIAIPCGPTLKQDLSAADHIVRSLCDVTPELIANL